MAGMVTPFEGYHRVVAYGKKKTNLPWPRLIGLALLAGFWIAMAGHISTVAASSFYNKTVWAGGITKLVYGATFPVAFVCIIFTSAELYTGNTMAMMIYALHHMTKLEAWLALLKNWSVVLVCNYAGCIFGAFLFSWSTGSFDPDHPQQHLFLESICKKKMSYDFGPLVAHAIGCNILVCVTTFSTIIIEEAIGKLFAVWFLISAFVFGNFEHVIANFYTLGCCSFVNEYGIKFGDTFTRNLFGVLIGNTIAGAIVCGAVWWFLLSPLDDKQAVAPADSAGHREAVIVEKDIEKGQLNAPQRKSVASDWQSGFHYANEAVSTSSVSSGSSHSSSSGSTA